MLIMALDVGTSSTRASCFDLCGTPVPDTEARVGYEPSITADGGVEIGADTLLDAVVTAVDGCVAAVGRRGEQIQAVGASIFWHSLLALDAGGAPLSAVITWADTRSAAAAAELRRTLDEWAIHRRTGAPLHSAFFPAKLRWLQKAQPEVFSRARTWCGFAEYLAARLTGSLRASVSMASGTGLMDQHTAQWDPGLLAACEVDAATLPPIDDTPAHGLTRQFAARWPGLAHARWYPGHGDGACSNIGSDCVGPDRVALNLGTSAAMRMVTTAGDAAAAGTPWGLWRYRVDRQRSLVGGATSEGGNVLAWCRRVLALPAEDGAFAESLAAIAPDAHRLVALPFLSGERSVGWRGDARAVLSGLSLDTSAIDILRALMEAVALRLSLVYERLAPLADPAHTVVASGGAFRHAPGWAAIISDALGVPIALAREPEASARGAALLALASEGAPPAAALPLGKTFSPRADHHDIYLAARKRQARLYESVVGRQSA
jgi:gluconokinase